MFLEIKLIYAQNVNFQKKIFLKGSGVNESLLILEDSFQQNRLDL